MSVRGKLLLIVIFVAAVPLAIATTLGLRLHQRAVDRQVAALQARAAEQGAAIAAAYFDEVSRGAAGLAGKTIRWHELDPEQRDHALWLVYRQRDEIAVASLLDEKGRGLGASAYLAPGAGVSELAAHPHVEVADLDGFGRAIPLSAALADGIALGEPFAAAGGTTVAPLALRAGGGGASFVVAIGLSLAPLCARLREGEGAGDALVVELLDAQGRAVCGSGGADGRQPLRPVEPALATASPGGLSRVRGAGGADEVAARALLSPGASPGLAAGWSVVSHQPHALAFAESTRLRRQSWLWLGVSVLVALAAGLYLARGITGPIAELLTSARELTEGRYDRRVAVHEQDELGSLAQAFNGMSDAIRARDREIRGWNEQLQQRVDDRTRELREAQGLLLESQKVSAVASLAAGFAHEINNPLAGVLGLTQILHGAARKDPAREKDARLLASVEKEAQRIREIVEKVMSLSQAADRGFQPLDVHETLEAALRLAAPRLAQVPAEVARELSADLPRVAGAADQLQHALGQVIDNAIVAMRASSTRRLTLATSCLEGRLVRIEVRDTGKGIAPEHLDRVFEPFFTTKQDWEGKGLGLTFAFRTIEAHRGMIKIASTVSVGTTVTITLPVAREGAHLS